jgi:hypothetical protein
MNRFAEFVGSWLAPELRGKREPLGLEGTLPATGGGIEMATNSEGTNPDIPALSRDAVLAALLELLAAHRIAHDLNSVSPWDHAVELAALCATGSHYSGLRWLVEKHLLQQRAETTGPEDRQRRFEDACPLFFSQRSCFLLTAKGVALAEGLFVATAAGTTSCPVGAATEEARALRPLWDAVSRRLYLGATLVKEFRQPAGNQELLLQALEKSGWAESVRDPLPSIRGRSRRKRLEDAVRRLNRNQKVPLLHFLVQGDGKSFGWERRLAALSTPHIWQESERT